MSIKSIITRGFGSGIGVIKDIITRGFSSGLPPVTSRIDWCALSIYIEEKPKVTFEEKPLIYFETKGGC